MSLSYIFKKFHVLIFTISCFNNIIQLFKFLLSFYLTCPKCNNNNNNNNNNNTIDGSTFKILCQQSVFNSFSTSPPGPGGSWQPADVRTPPGRGGHFMLPFLRL